MALAREMMGSSLMEKSSFLASSTTRRLVLQQQRNRSFLPLEGRRVQVVIRRSTTTTPVVAAISEDLDLVKVVPEKAVKFKVRAVVTVRNKNKEDFKETLVKHVDAFTDKIGRNVALELISTDYDPSEFKTQMFLHFFCSKSYSHILLDEMSELMLACNGKALIFMFA